MKVFGTEMVEQQVVKDILCNRCGKSTKVDGPEAYEAATMTESWGYWSRKDTFDATWHLCESCCEIVTKDFKIPVQHYSHMFQETLSELEAKRDSEE